MPKTLMLSDGQQKLIGKNKLGDKLEDDWSKHLQG
jgi:hypothetical protein